MNCKWCFPHGIYIDRILWKDFFSHGRSVANFVHQDDYNGPFILWAVEPEVDFSNESDGSGVDA
jgi:hypothetical protein